MMKFFSFLLFLFLGYPFDASAQIYSDVDAEIVNTEMQTILKKCDNQALKIKCIEKQVHDYLADNFNNECGQFIIQKLEALKKAYIPMYQKICQTKNKHSALDCPSQYYEYFLKDLLFIVISEKKKRTDILINKQ